MFSHEASPLDPPSPNVAAGQLRIKILMEGAGNYLDELQTADDAGNEEYATALLGDLELAMDNLGVPLRDWVFD